MKKILLKSALIGGGVGIVSVFSFLTDIYFGLRTIIQFLSYSLFDSLFMYGMISDIIPILLIILTFVIYGLIIGFLIKFFNIITMKNKKITTIVLTLSGLVLSFFAGMFWTKFQYDNICLDMGGGRNPGSHEICVLYEHMIPVEPNEGIGDGAESLDKLLESHIHYTWDMNEDGVNDCEDDNTCDDMEDYSKPRYKIPGVDNDIVFDIRSQKWVDTYGICHTCTPENGFKLNGTLDESMFKNDN